MTLIARTSKFKILTIVSYVACLSLAGCTSSCKTAGPKTADVKHTPDKGEAKPGETKPDGKVPPPVAPKKPEMLAGSHILIAYKGAMKAKPDVKRLKDKKLPDGTPSAKEVAIDLKKKLNAKNFAEMAKKHSEGPSAARGGDLGAWPKGRMVPAFDKAIDGLKVGEISEPVETPFGYHVMIRNELPPMHAGSHILIAYKGAKRAAPTVTRPKEGKATDGNLSAKDLAKELAAKARKPGADFAALAKKYSDGPSGPKGGSLGVWPKGMMVPEFDKAIEGMKVGDVSAPVETPFGYHVIKRTDPDAAPAS